MPVWTPRNVKIDVNLTNQVLGIAPQTDQVIFDKIMPTVQVKRESGMIWKWVQGDLFRVPVDTLRAPKTKGAYMEYAVTSDSYQVKERALRTEISFQQNAEADEVFGDMLGAATKVRDSLLLDAEYRMAVSETGVSSINNVGSGTTLSGTDQWSDYDNSDPISDIEAAIDSIESSTGYTPNLMVLPRKVFHRLKHHPLIRGNFDSVQAGPATVEHIKNIFDIENVLIARSKVNTGNKDAASVSYTDVWGTNVLIARIAAGPRLDGKEPSLGYNYRYANSKYKVSPFMVERWDDTDGGDFTNIRVKTYETPKLTFTQLGYVIASAVA